MPDAEVTEWPGTWPIATRCVACAVGACDICVQLETPERFCGCACDWLLASDLDDPVGA